MERTWRNVIAELERRVALGDKTAPAEKPPRMAGALKKIGYFQSPFFEKWGARRTIVVAGTNGKGSTCAALEALLLAAGCSPAFYSSPHLIEYTERLRLKGQDVTREQFVDAFFEVRSRLADFSEEPKLTHFEILTLTAIHAIAVSDADWMILEVGLGGTYDATNCVPHDTAVITPLGMDHEELLGPTLPDIARNKLGVIPQTGRVFHAPFPSEIAAVVSEAKKSSSADFVQTKACSMTVEAGHPPRYRIHTPWGETENSLVGARGCENAGLALTIADGLGFDVKNLMHALKGVRWPGRMEFLGRTAKGATVYLSGDHNPSGMESLTPLLDHYDREKLYVLFGAGREKDLDGMLGPLFKLRNTEVFLTEIQYKPRLIDDYGPWSARAVGREKDPESAFKFLVDKADGRDMILVTGSLHLVGMIKKKGRSFRIVL